MAACPNQSELAPETDEPTRGGSRDHRWSAARHRGPGAAAGRRSQTAHAIDRALRAGRLHRVHRGVYAAVAPELLTEEGHLVAALLAAGEGALLSHGTAAWRWRIIAAPPSVIELAVPRSARADRGA